MIVWSSDPCNKVVAKATVKEMVFDSVLITNKLHSHILERN